MSQSKTGSFWEAIANTAWACFRSIVITNFYFMAMGIPVPLIANIALTGILTVFSLVEKFWFRRLFIKWFKG